MRHQIDDGRLNGLIEQSDDLHADAMRAARSGLNEYVEAAQEAQLERERSGWAAVPLVVGAVGAAMLAGASTAFAQNNDVAALQTAAGLENLAVGTYQTALTLPFIGGAQANGVVKAFAEKTMMQHTEHAQAFNAAAQKLGGKPQTGTPAKYQKLVTDAVPGIKGPADVVGLAITLEDVAAQTYVKDVSLVSSGELRQLFASVAGVEAQHVAILLAVQALLNAGAPQLIALPPDVAKLPGGAGTVGFPNAFYKTDMAAGAQEGAVQ